MFNFIKYYYDTAEARVKSYNELLELEHSGDKSDFTKREIKRLTKKVRELATQEDILRCRLFPQGDII